MVFFDYNKPAPKGFALYPYGPPTTNPCDNCNASFESSRDRLVLCHPCDWWNQSSCWEKGKTEKELADCYEWHKKYKSEQEAKRLAIPKEEREKIQADFEDKIREWFTWKEFFYGLGALIVVLSALGVWSYI